MVHFKQGVVSVKFPFSDLSRAKRRPALVLACAGKGDWVLCQITSKPYADPKAVVIKQEDFAQGKLSITSYARPGKLFTAHQSLLEAPVDTLTGEKNKEVISGIISLLEM